MHCVRNASSGPLKRRYITQSLQQSSSLLGIMLQLQHQPKTDYGICRTLVEHLSNGGKSTKTSCTRCYGGKDSTVLAYIMKLLNDRYNYGLKLVLLSVDEGITGYRDDSLETVKRNEQQYDIPLKVVSYEELYGWTMDRIVQETGRKSNCTFCGVFRRQALDRGATLLEVDKIVTGHNADDIAETVLMNILRGDIARLQRCTALVTGSEGAISRSKPFKYTYEKEIVMYAYFKKLDYFSTECIYSPNAYRGYARAFLKDLEKIRATTIIDIIHSGECFSVREGIKLPTQSTCECCGHISSQPICKACVLLEGLNKGKPKLGIGKTSKVREHMNEIINEKLGDEPKQIPQTTITDAGITATHHNKNKNLDF
ncbi:cytoplasmic tRNA 2-thiolation protein 1-like isoform X2 [Homarus americanus]|uniref:cytoplasmic tRNA 2-thiolation protein 1-like isoform X2 n=1 Tax=Homarus americanus TaxID=6706 RepID=UPI001C437ECC|nr:cytoplasmic tRNA 2-thiolation protein 1-like isoform X2 [Homarus americanus]